MKTYDYTTYYNEPSANTLEVARQQKVFLQTFSDLPSSSLTLRVDCRLKYKSEVWDGRWLDVTSTFSWSTRMQG